MGVIVLAAAAIAGGLTGFAALWTFVDFWSALLGAPLVGSTVATIAAAVLATLGGFADGEASHTIASLRELAQQGRGFEERRKWDCG
jgi:hypothetical protein